MKSILNWWNSLDSSTRQAVVVGVVTAISTAVLTTYVPKVVWPILKRAGVWIRENVYQRLAGFSLFNQWALNRYRRSSRSDLLRVINPWSHQRLVLDNMFVPIKVETKYQLPQLVPGQKLPESLLDLRDAAREYKRFVLVGEPGAGKSTALKSLGIACLEGRLFPGEEGTLPVYIELRKYSRAGLSLFDYLPSVFETYGFPKASKFIQRAISKGRLVILLDGLDEVSDENFQPVIERIREFCSSHGHNRLVVSCRSAAYERQLDDLSEGTISLTHFNNIQIVGFLRHWTFPSNKSSVDLMRILNDRPRILSICRNPLMLTIVTSLYSETDYELPSSRAEFYRTCVDAVLKRWDRARQVDRSNKFPSSVKMRVLQRIALNLQEHSETGDFRIAELIKFVSEILPDIGLGPELAEEIMTEIVVNSGLLIYVGPQRLRFAHLTFQEFFAAIEINDTNSASLLLDHFKKNPRRWREVCLLYCGTSSRSNDFVSALVEYDVVTAANCVADSENIAVALAKTIIESLVRGIQHAKRRELPKGIVTVNAKRGVPVDEAVDLVHRELESLLQALSLLAADQRRAWSSTAFDSLRTFFHKSTEDFHKFAAISALANVPNEAAARELITALQKRETTEVAKRALAQLGVIGLPALKQVLRSSREEELLQVCLEICAQIPYPEVIDILVPFLNSDNLLIRATAAWALAVLIQDPAIANSLELLKPGELYTPLKNNGPRQAELIKWVWPFHSQDSGEIRNLMATVVSCLSPDLIQDLATKEGANARIDIRVAVPVSIQLFTAQPPGELEAGFKRTVAKILLGDEMAWDFPPRLGREGLVSTIMLTHSVSTFSLHEIFETDAHVLKESWKNVLEKGTDEPFYLTRTMAQIMSVIYLFVGLFLTRPSSFLPLSCLLITLIILTRFWARRLDQDAWASLLSVPAGGVVYIKDLTRRHWTSLRDLIFLVVGLLFILAWTAYVGFLGASFLRQPWSALAAASYAFVASSLFGSKLTGRTRQSNPWVPFLELPTPQKPPTVVGAKPKERTHDELTFARTLSPSPTIIGNVKHSPKRSRTSEITAIMALALSLLVLIGLISYRASDLGSGSAVSDIRNWTGTIGAHVSQRLFQAVGLGAFLLPPLFWLAAWAQYRQARIGFRSVSAAVGLILATATLITLFNVTTPFQWDFPVGGIAGAFIASGLTTRFPSLIAFALSILSLVACSGWVIDVSWLRADSLLKSILGKTSR